MIDHQPIVIVFAPVLLTAFVVASVLGFLHLFFRAGFVFGQDLPRWAAYMVGVGTIGLAFTGLELLGRPSPVDTWIPVLDLWIITVAASVPTLALRGVQSSATLKRLESIDNDRNPPRL